MEIRYFTTLKVALFISFKRIDRFLVCSDALQVIVMYSNSLFTLIKKGWC